MRASRLHRAYGILAAFQGGASVDQLTRTWSTSQVRITAVPAITFALVGCTVCAMRISSATGTTHGRSNGRHTEMIRVSHETFRALASSGVRVTSCVESTVFATTSVNTPSIFARFRPARAGVASRAENRLAIATRERVAHHAFQTNTRRTLGTDDALCVVAANHSFT